jgi:hypothetical protein
MTQLNLHAATLGIDEVGIVTLSTVSDGTPFLHLTDAGTGKSVCITIDAITGKRILLMVAAALEMLDPEMDDE